MTAPLFSICIPNYNYAHYIDQTIDSVLSQTFQDFEIIIADNASTDNSLEVIQSYDDPRIKLVLNQYNVGFAPNLDRATENTTGQYILLLSSDDIMKPGALTRYAEAIYVYRKQKNENQPDSLIVFSAIDIIDSEGAITRQLPARPWANTARFEDACHEIDVFKYNGLEILNKRMATLGCVGRFLTTCVSRPLYDSVCGYRTVHTIDPDTFFAYKCMLQDPVVVYIDDYLFQYRMHDQGQATQQKKQGAPRYFIDLYYYTIEFSDDELARVGVARQELVDSFLDNKCGTGAIVNALRGNSRLAWQAFFIAAATYPQLYFRRWRSYLLLFILITGPIAPAIATLLRRFIPTSILNQAQKAPEPYEA